MQVWSVQPTSGTLAGLLTLRMMRLERVPEVGWQPWAGFRRPTGHLSPLSSPSPPVRRSARAALNEALENLLTDADERGYVLATELAAVDTAGDVAWLQDATERARDHGLVVVDDLTDEDAHTAAPVPHAMADPVRWYLDRAASHDLLDAQQEMDLAKRYRAGLAAQQLLDHETLPARRLVLRRIVTDAERAREKLISHNLRLVVPTAKRYAGRDLDLLEAIQEANLGLIRAVEKFDHTKGYKFSTYAVWWIRQASQRGLASQSRTIRVPASVWEDRAKVRRAESDLRSQLGRDATVEEVAEATGLRAQRIRDVEEALQPMTSLDRPVGEDGDAAFGDLLPDQEAGDPATLAVRTDAHNRLLVLLDALEPRERRIIELRFGLEDGRMRTYDEIGAEIGLQRERVRQLAKQATDKLRTPEAAAQLRTLKDELAA